ncbi:hypothetical protein IQ266_16660 [filamentous cyanobacterium LEGE 11480]|uniref:Uncharacterized protein n=1 Tax=Romeriopsis navalis LEGE 11480 TaxID=2777977 RepID=A0A928Z4U0_9CYAN|nr:DUF6335 family protein [Romeriopsis navalis]MBE9031367.1 hypothetical protein [Romeriopsis navalis LEGE 11480]
MIEKQADAITGGDCDANTYQASVAGEEAVGGSASVPGQNDTDQLAAAVGIEVTPEMPLQLSADMSERDDHRWELNQASETGQQL